MDRRAARMSLALLGLALAFVAGRVVSPAAAEPPISGPVRPSDPPAPKVPPPAPVPSPAPAAAADSVLAKRYRVPMADSALEWAQGDYVWVEELYLPDRGLAANVRWDMIWRADPIDPAKSDFVVIPRMTAFASPKVRNQYRDLDDNKIGRESPIEDVRIPKALADEIAALAELTRRVDDAKTKLGAETADGKWIRQFNHDGAEVAVTPPANPSVAPPPLPAMK